jgi:hypothetical protein
LIAADHDDDLLVGLDGDQGAAEHAAVLQRDLVGADGRGRGRRIGAGDGGQDRGNGQREKEGGGSRQAHGHHCRRWRRRGHGCAASGAAHNAFLALRAASRQIPAMASRRNTFDDKLARLRALGTLPPPKAIAELRALLTDANGYLVGEAAKAAASLELRELIPDLAAAFPRLLAAPTAADKGCQGKYALVEALVALDADTPEVYLAGMRHVQLEPTYGPPVDTAATLRGLCAHALVRIDHRGAVQDIAPLLHDAEPVTRAAAADALASTNNPLCGAVLHVKVLAGDAEADVLGACYRGLLALEPQRYLPLVAAALDRGEEAAAIALGESRRPEALSVLQKALDAGGARMQDTVLLGISLLRSEAAITFLVELVAEAPEGRAAAALGALALHRHDTRASARVREAVAARGSRRLARALEEHFGKEMEGSG